MNILAEGQKPTDAERALMGMVGAGTRQATVRYCNAGSYLFGCGREVAGWYREHEGLVTGPFETEALAREGTITTNVMAGAERIEEVPEATRGCAGGIKLDPRQLAGRATGRAGSEDGSG